VLSSFVWPSTAGPLADCRFFDRSGPPSSGASSGCRRPSCRARRSRPRHARSARIDGSRGAAALESGSGKDSAAAEIDFGQPVSDRGPGLLRDLELDRPPGLLLDHGPAVPHPATGAHVLDLYRDEIAATQLAVDREVEQGEVALPTLKLKPDPDCPHLLRLERVLLADQATLVPGRPRKAHNSRDRSVHGRLLGPDRPLSQRTPTTAASQPNRGRLFAYFPDDCVRLAAVARRAD
jgi:hypothetical protein